MHFLRTILFAAFATAIPLNINLIDVSPEPGALTIDKRFPGNSNSGPEKSKPTKSKPAKSKPAKSKPSKSKPSKSKPSKSKPAKSGGAQAPGTFTTSKDFGGEVRWQDWTSKDGITDGADKDKIYHVKKFIDLVITRAPEDKRTGVFWSGGSTTTADFDNIKEFIKEELKDKAIYYRDVYFPSDMVDQGLPSTLPRSNHYWRMANRNSKALAASVTNGKAYVYMIPNNGRTIFSPSSQTPKDDDPKHGGKASNGEIWYYSELPTLMRNLNIDQIITFHKDAKTNKFVQSVGWDVHKDLDKPRTHIPDTHMDATPIILPAAAERPALKRAEIVRY
ncbi:hypothetical protein G7Y89_g5086 [Cudoniella acicularis]|uniref:Uncharacterized protein n=1 Tax=Cudoniella acicularis TaxID=354080 RepID=A0A8H4RQ80_9HELO|nr:hypothetical protein G7Y89_g5086 [Cudoniella acicularis]